MSSRFTANDEERKIKAMLLTTMAEEVTSGKLQDLGLIGILDYTCNVIQNQPQKLDVYIHDYLVKRGLNASAKAFMQEGKVCTEPVGKKFLIQ